MPVTSGSRPFISGAKLVSLRKKVGPQIGGPRLEIWRKGVPERRGAGMAAGAPALTATVPANIQYVGMLAQSEKEALGTIIQKGNYIINLPALTDIVKDDTLVQIGWAWEASKKVYQGYRVSSSVQLATPVKGATLMYESDTEKGVTGTVEPDWPTVKGQTVVDGTVTWKCVGVSSVFDIAEIMQPTTYELSRDLIANIIE